MLAQASENFFSFQDDKSENQDSCSSCSSDSEERPISLLKEQIKDQIELGLPIFSIQRKEQETDVFEKYSRKEKSLGQLSRRFLEIFGAMTDQEVSLDSVTQRLGVERRRIYDIINILESLGVVFRKGKNHYFWIGLVAIKRKILQVRIGANFGQFAKLIFCVKFKFPFLA